MPNLKVINSLMIDTLYGSKEFTLMHGDISQVQADLLVFSTHSGKGKPAGAVLRSLSRRYGKLDFHSMLKIFSFAEDSYFKLKTVHPTDDSYSVPFDIYFIAPSSNMPFENLLMLRMPSPAYFPTKEEALSAYEKAVAGIFCSIATLEFNGNYCKTVALPLLGGTRSFPKREVMSIILENSIKWLNYSAHTQQIILTIYNDNQIRVWNDVMNSSLDRTILDRSDYEDSITALRVALQKNSITYMSIIRSDIICGVLKSLLKALNNDKNIYIEQLGMYGRKLAEVIAAQMCNDLALKKNHHTFANIEEIAKSQHVSKWISTYLHCLRVLGNESVHVVNNRHQRIPKRLTEGDLLVIFSNILRVLDFYILWQDYVTDLF